MSTWTNPNKNNATIYNSQRSAQQGYIVTDDLSKILVGSSSQYYLAWNIATTFSNGGSKNVALMTNVNKN